MIIDKLYQEVEKKGPICVGLDIHIDHIPKKIKEKYNCIGDIFFNFNKKIIDSTSDLTAVYKPQIAYYEAHGIEGLKAYAKTLKYLKENNLLSISDIKRGDISSTATMYAEAHFKGEFAADFITLNPYMGFDSLTPYFPYIENENKGIFVLLRTSNPGSQDIEYLKVDNEELYYNVGDRMRKMAEKFIGDCGYSSLGFVVGGNYNNFSESEEIRNRYKNIFFLIPGYGAQGGTANDAVKLLNNKNGGVVNSSRGIIRAYEKYEDGETNYEKYIREAVLKMIEDFK